MEKGRKGCCLPFDVVEEYVGRDLLTCIKLGDLRRLQYGPVLGNRTRIGWRSLRCIGCLDVVLDHGVKRWIRVL